MLLVSKLMFLSLSITAFGSFILHHLISLTLLFSFLIGIGTLGMNIALLLTPTIALLTLIQNYADFICFALMPGNRRKGTKPNGVTLTLTFYWSSYIEQAHVIFLWWADKKNLIISKQWQLFHFWRKPPNFFFLIYYSKAEWVEQIFHLVLSFSSFQTNAEIDLNYNGVKQITACSTSLKLCWRKWS